MHPKRPAEIFQLFASTTSLAGVGAKLASVLEKRVGQHVIDVLRHLPIGMIDRSQRPSLANVDDGAIATFDCLVIKHDRPPRGCLLYTSPSPRDRTRSRMPSSA